jgi:hypothetical protein
VTYAPRPRFVDDIICKLLVHSSLGIVGAFKSSRERRGRVVNTSTPYMGGLGFKSRSGNRLSWLRSTRFFFSSNRRILGP